MDNFNTILIKYKNLLRRLTLKLKKGRLCLWSHDEISQLVLISSYYAYLAWQRQKNKFEFGAYLNLSIQYVLRKFHRTEILNGNILSDVGVDNKDIELSHTKDLIDASLVNLTQDEKKVIHLIFYENKNISDCMPILKLSWMQIKEIENSALQKIKNYVEQQTA